QVVLPGVSNTQVELRLLKPEPGKAVGFELLRVRDVSSNGTGIQESGSTSSKPTKLKKDVDVQIAQGSCIVFPLRTKVKTEDGQARITIRALSGKAAPPPDPPVDVVTKSPEPPVPVEKLAPVEREEETPLPGADELLKLDEMKLDNGDKEAETPQVPYAPNEDAPKLQEGGKAERRLRRR
ncbi:unnamed protein product, partial [Durusdinium trenchii]